MRSCLPTEEGVCDSPELEVVGALEAFWEMTGALVEGS
jgi:hypothetical protein